MPRKLLLRQTSAVLALQQQQRHRDDRRGRNEQAPTIHFGLPDPLGSHNSCRSVSTRLFRSSASSIYALSSSPCFEIRACNCALPGNSFCPSCQTLLALPGSSILQYASPSEI